MACAEITGLICADLLIGKERQNRRGDFGHDLPNKGQLWRLGLDVLT
jgi:hypothetical protein